MASARRAAAASRASALTHIHPQRILAQVLNALQERVGLRPAGRRRRHHGQRLRRRRPRDGHRPHGRPRRRLAGHRPGRHAQPLLRLGPAGRELRRDGRPVRPAGTASSAGGVESMSRPAAPQRRRLHRQQRPPLRAVPAGAAGHLGRPHRHDRRASRARTATRSACRASAAPPRRSPTGRFKRSVVPIYNDDGTLALDHDEYPRAGHHAGEPRRAQAVVREDGRHEPAERHAHVRRDLQGRLPADRRRSNHVHHAGNSSGVVDGASAVLVASPEYAKAHGLKPRARIVMTATAGAEPVIMLTAPGAGRRTRAEEGRHDERRHRPVRDQRGVRRGRAQVQDANSASTTSG